MPLAVLLGATVFLISFLRAYFDLPFPFFWLMSMESEQQDEYQLSCTVRLVSIVANKLMQ